MKKVTVLLYAALLAPALPLPFTPGSPVAYAQDHSFSDLTMNGMAAFEQLRREYYIGALLMEFPSRDPARILESSGRKRLAMHITADRWPPMRFAQQWNQSILINSDSATLNANVMDVLAFTSFPKEDLVAGDQLYVDLRDDGKTEVSLNGKVMMRTDDGGLFHLIAASWIGPRPPSSDFKQALLALAAAEKADLLSRFEMTAPSPERRRQVAAWSTERNEPAIATAPAAAAAGEVRARPEPMATRAVATTPSSRAVEPSRAQPAVAEVEAPRAKPIAVSASAPVPAPEVATSTSTPTAAAAIPTSPAPQSPPEAMEAPPLAMATPAAIEPAVSAAPNPEQQKRLYGEYSGKLRSLVYSKLKYPRRAVDKNIEGLVVIKVEVDRGGQLLQVSAAQSAHRLLDNAAIDAVEEAAPFPQPATKLQGDRLSFLIPVVFKLAE
jgi:TonB family protein